MTAPTIAPPYAAPPSQPQLAPYGFFGDLISSVAPTVGGWVGGQTGQQVGNVAGQLARYLPFSAGPQMAPRPHPAQQPQLAPYGLVGDLISAVAPTVGDWIAGDTGRQVGDIAGQFATYLPFAAGPQMAPMPHPAQQPQLAPYGFFGDLIGQVAPQVGRWVGGQTGQEIAQVAGGLAQRYLPFAAGPQLPQAPMPQPQLAPYGLLGGALGNVLGGIGGGALGGWLGNRGAGEAIGRAAGSVLGGILPFGAGPVPTYPYAAQVPQYGPYGR